MSKHAGTSSCLLCFDPDCCGSGGKNKPERTDTHRIPIKTVYATQITSHKSLPKEKKITLARQSASARCPRALGTYDTTTTLSSTGTFCLEALAHAGRFTPNTPRQKASTPPPTPIGERHTINSSVFDNTQHTAQYLNPPLALYDTNSTHAGDDPSTEEGKKKNTMGFTSSNASTASA